MKPYYDDGAVTIYHADYLDLVEHLDTDVVITDPPYGTGHYRSDNNVFTSGHWLLSRFAVRHKTTAVFGWPENLVRLCSDALVCPDEWITWWATNKTTRSSGLLRECECIAVFGEMPGLERATVPRSGVDPVTSGIHRSRGNDVENRRAGDVWREAAPGMAFNAHERQHPNEKPMPLMRRLVDLCSSTGQTVLDPFCGSGTTLRAAKDLGRKAVGVEIEERFCEVAAKRCSQEVLDLEKAA